jgi:hypothetical protein
MDDLPQPTRVLPAPPASKWGLFIRRVRSGIIQIRRAGVPHEETVIIPAIALNLAARVSIESGWRFVAANVSLLMVVFICGAWLGFAWRGFPVVRVLLRTVYIGILAVLLDMLTHNEPVSKHVAVHTVGLVVSTIGLMFYFGYFYAAMVRDVALRRFPSEKHRTRYLARSD